MPTPGPRDDPFAAFSFLLEIDGILCGGFTSVSGLAVHTDVETFHEGGFNDRQRITVGVTNYDNLVLKHGLTSDDSLWAWFASTRAGTVQRKNATLFVVDPATRKRPVAWNLVNAFPIRWEGPGFAADGDQVAVESLTITFEELDRQGGPAPVP